MTRLPSGRAAEIDLPAALSSASDARRFLSATLGAWGCGGLVPDAVTIASELVTNAVLHAASAPTLRVLDVGERIRIEVVDTSVVLPVLLAADTASVGGRGLHIVASMAADWGVRLRREGGKVVWSDLDKVPATVGGAAGRDAGIDECLPAGVRHGAELEPVLGSRSGSGGRPRGRDRAAREDGDGEAASARGKATAVLARYVTARETRQWTDGPSRTPRPGRRAPRVR